MSFFEVFVILLCILGNFLLVYFFPFNILLDVLCQSIELIDHELNWTNRHLYYISKNRLSSVLFHVLNFLLKSLAKKCIVLIGPKHIPILVLNSKSKGSFCPRRHRVFRHCEWVLIGHSEFFSISGDSS